MPTKLYENSQISAEAKARSQSIARIKSVHLLQIACRSFHNRVVIASAILGQDDAVALVRSFFHPRHSTRNEKTGRNDLSQKLIAATNSGIIADEDESDDLALKAIKSLGADAPDLPKTIDEEIEAIAEDLRK